MRSNNRGPQFSIGEYVYRKGASFSTTIIYLSAQINGWSNGQRIIPGGDSSTSIPGWLHHLHCPRYPVRNFSIHRSKINWTYERTGQLDNNSRRRLDPHHLLRIPTDSRAQVVNIFTTATFIYGLQHGLGTHQVESSVPSSKTLLTFCKARVDAEDPNPPSDTITNLKVRKLSELSKILSL